MSGPGQVDTKNQPPPQLVTESPVQWDESGSCEAESRACRTSDAMQSPPYLSPVVSLRWGEEVSSRQPGSDNHRTTTSALDGLRFQKETAAWVQLLLFQVFSHFRLNLLFYGGKREKNGSRAKYIHVCSAFPIAFLGLLEGINHWYNSCYVLHFRKEKTDTQKG